MTLANPRRLIAASMLLALRIFWSLGSWRKTPRGRILVFHHIDPEGTAPQDLCHCPEDVFTANIQAMKKAGYRFIDIDDVEARMRSGTSSPFAVITFDDIPESVFSRAYPFLKRLGIPFVVYISMKYLDTPGYISTEQLLILNEEPLCRIGAHTMTHPNLRKAKNGYREMLESRRYLEKLLKKPIRHFAYPYGRFVTVALKNIREAHRAGFRTAVSTIPAELNALSWKSRFFLPRIPINRRMKRF